MKRVVYLDEELLKRTKKVAAQSGRTLTAVIEDALRSMLEQQQERVHSPALSQYVIDEALKKVGFSPRQPVRLTVVRGHGLLPGVDIDNASLLLDLMETGHDAF